MKIRIQNLGPILDYEFDLDKDLHLIYGKNAIGKSHAIECLYIILKNLVDAFTDSKIEYHSYKLYKESIDKDNNKIDNNDIAEQILREVFVSNLIKSLKQTFPNIHFNQSDIYDYDAEEYKESTIINVKDNNWDIQIGHIDNDLVPEGDLANINFLDDFVLDNLITLNKKIDLYFLPANRSGLQQSISTLSPLIALISQQANDINIKLPVYSEPESDFILRLISAKQNGKADIFNDFAGKIEKNILQGSISIDNTSKGFKYYDNRFNINMDLARASSMINDLAPLVSYLKFIMKKEKKKNSLDFLFIEEPESHLHPSVQVALMAIFAEMANNGIKVIMTTHSDFMFNELTNLILANKIKAEQVASVHLVMTDKGSKDAGDMQATAEGMDDFNFGDVSMQLYNDRMRLLELKNQQDALSEN